MQLTHEDWLHGVHVWQVLQGDEQPQFAFGAITVPLGAGTRGGCDPLPRVRLGAYGLGAVEYLTTCVLIGVRDGGLLGTRGFVWLANGDGAGLLLVLLVSRVCGCFIAGSGGRVGFGTATRAGGNGGNVASGGFTVGAVTGTGFGPITGAAARGAIGASGGLAAVVVPATGFGVDAGSGGRGGIVATCCFAVGVVPRAGFGAGAGAGGRGGIVASRAGALGCGGRRIGCGVTTGVALGAAGCIGGAVWTVEADGVKFGQLGCGVGRIGCGAATGVAGFRAG